MSEEQPVGQYAGLREGGREGKQSDTWSERKQEVVWGLIGHGKDLGFHSE